MTLCVATTSGAEPIEVAVEVKGEQSLPVVVSIGIAPLDSPDHSVDFDLLLADRSGSQRVEVDQDGSLLKIEARADGYWAADTVIEGNGEPKKVIVSLWPASGVRVQVRTPDSTSSPSSINLRLSSASQPQSNQEDEEHEVSCALVKKASTSCVLPAGHWDIRAKVESFTPHFLWKNRFPVGEQIDIGTLRLEVGASIFGRVQSAQGTVAPRGTTVAAYLPASETGASDRPKPNIDRQVMSATVNEWGTGVPAGAYKLVAQGHGNEPSRPHTVLVRPDLDIELDEPLVLQQLVRLALSVVPANDHNDSPWKLSLYRKRSAGDFVTVAESRTENGSWLSSPIVPGDYAVELYDNNGNRVHWAEFIAENDFQLVPIELDQVAARGEVLLGREPLVGQLRFTSPKGAESVTASSDEEGRVQLMLPREGSWKVDVTSDDPSVFTRALDLHVEKEADSGEFEFRIELPDTALVGKVVDESGLPVPEAHIVIASHHPAAVVASDTDGEFEVRGLVPGTYIVSARTKSDESSSASEAVTVDEDYGPTSIHLVLRKRTRISGTVSSPGGRVARALLLAYPISHDRIGEMMLPQARSKSDGSFQLDLPGHTTQARLAILAPGYDFYLALLDSSALTRSIFASLSSPLGGSLRLKRPQTAPQGAPALPLVFVNGQPVDVALLELWSQINETKQAGNDDIMIPAMPSGSYWYCNLTMEEGLLVLVGAAQPKQTSCSADYLNSGGVLSLALPQ